jgi:hypothetical protein
MATKPRTSGDIIRLKVTLLDIRPPIWRRLLMPAKMTLRDLHVAIQVSVGWEEGHLHAFDIGDERYSDPGMLDDAINEAKLTLAAINERGIKRFRYTYDFGDDWEHDILLEGSEPPVPEALYPTCTAGKRHGPPEDCGGPFGYEDLLAILADPSHPEHEERREWLGGELDPEAFSMADINDTLRTRFGPRKRPR